MSNPRRALLSLTLATALLTGGMPAYAAPSGSADSLWQEALSLQKQERWLEAARAAEQSAELEQASPQPRWQGYVQVIGNCAWDYDLAGDTASACRVLARGTKRLKEAGQTALAVPRIIQLAKYQQATNDHDAARKTATEAVAAARETNQPNWLAPALNRLGMIENDGGRYADAIACYDEALPIARRLNDEQVMTDVLVNSAYANQDLGRHPRALELFAEALVITRRRGDVGYEAQVLSRMASSHLTLGRYDQALASVEAAIALLRRAGQPKALAMALNTLASVQEARGQIAEALASNEEALRIQRAEGIRYAEGRSLSAIAWLHGELGRYDEALRTYEQALAIARSLKIEADEANILNDMGVVHQTRGDFGKALELYEAGLAVDRRLGREVHIAVGLSNIGALYSQWGRPDLAEPLYEQALAMDRAGDRRVRVAMGLSNLSEVHLDLGRLPLALSCQEEALAIFRQQQAEIDIAISLNSLGEINRAMGRHAQALTWFQESLALSRRLGRDSDVAAALKGIAAVHFDQANFKAMHEHITQALAIYRRLGRREKVADALSYLAIAQSRLNMPDQAIATLEEAVVIFDGLRQTAKGDMRRDYLATMMNTYHHLVDLHARAGRAEAALEASERSRAKSLAETLAGGSEAPIPAVTALRATLAPHVAMLVYANAAKPDRVQMALTRDGVVAQVHRFKPVATVATAPALPKAQPAKPTGTRGVEALEEADEASDLAGLVADYRSALVQRDATRARMLGRALYDALVLPLETRLSGKTELVVIPDANLGFVPFESLIDSQGRYLAERFTITYAHSLAVRGLLATRKHPAGRKPLLAFGGAKYQTAGATHRGAVSANARLAAYQTLSRGASMLDAYGKLGLASWADLPGTLREVQAIAKLQPGAHVVTGEQVSEAGLKAMATANQLAGYRVLHFATHGVTVPEVPELSALVLSQLPTQPGGEDGYLRTAEVAQLKLAADFVNLSACETGLGKLYGGEGVVGLSQSFLLAGANGLSMSLWSVADDSTATFMTELYKTVANDHVGYAEAAARVKRRFIQGAFGEAYKQPFYWAPFVHYGL
ncbi:MAG: CHAT domain-containing tetratricopeptide repeat protein [Candidatus Sericytochromatia bacterium]